MAEVANRLREPLATLFDRVPGPWRGVTEPFRASGTGLALMDFIDARVSAGAPVYPARLFRALEACTPEAVRVVILGQDPYHGANQAQGLAFSVAPGWRPLPPSLRNILTEVAADTGRTPACADDLSAWADQGVLLLNSVLSVEDGAPQSHAGRGWEVLTDALLTHVARHALPSAFLLWGAAAQRKRLLVEQAGAGRHAVLEANHPSPLSARRLPVPFIGCRHFSRANAFLRAARDSEAAQVRW